MKKAIKNKKAGAALGWLFALFAVVASFGIGNMTQANSISDAFKNTFDIPLWVTGIILTVLALVIIVGGIKTISKVSSIVVPFMAIFYVIAGLIVIIGNVSAIPEGLAMIFKMAFSVKAVGGGLCGSITAAMMNAMRFGVARGVFSNEAGMGSAAITAAAATTDSPVRQGYINMTGTFWDTIVVCTITGLCIASSGVLGSTDLAATGTYTITESAITVSATADDKTTTTEYTYKIDGDELVLTADGTDLSLTPVAEDKLAEGEVLQETWQDAAGNHYVFAEDGSYEYHALTQGSALTIKAFKTVLGPVGAWLVTIGIALFAFSTILGWEYHGEKAFEYILNTHKFNMVYRLVFSAVVFVGSTTALDLVWNFSDIANALMAVPNLICLLLLSKEIAADMQEFQSVIKKEKAAKKAAKETA